MAKAVGRRRSKPSRVAAAPARRRGPGKAAERGTAKKSGQGSPATSRPYFVHPQALVASTAIGPRTRIWAFAHVLAGAELGADCNICDGVFIESGVRLGDHVTVKNGVQLWMGVTCEDWVFLGPNATFTNDLRPRVSRPLKPEDFAKTHVETGASIGANATVVAGTRIGHHAFVGAGTVIIRDVPPHALVVGNPARQIGWACGCGSRLPRSLVCADCGSKHRRLGSGLEKLG